MMKSPDFRNKMKSRIQQNPREYVKTHSHLTIDVLEHISKRVSTPMTVIPKTHVALYDNYSLLNHSCRPNCNSFCIGGTIVVLCMFNLLPGEELTVSYCEEFDLQPRRENLLSIWGIDCDCRLCEEQ